MRGISKGITDIIFCILSFLINHSATIAIDIQLFYGEPLTASFGEVLYVRVSKALASILKITKAVESDC